MRELNMKEMMAVSGGNCVVAGQIGNHTFFYCSTSGPAQLSIGEGYGGADPFGGNGPSIGEGYGGQITLAQIASGGSTASTITENETLVYETSSDSGDTTGEAVTLSDGFFDINGNGEQDPDETTINAYSSLDNAMMSGTVSSSFAIGGIVYGTGELFESFLSANSLAMTTFSEVAFWESFTPFESTSCSAGDVCV